MVGIYTESIYSMIIFLRFTNHCFLALVLQKPASFLFYELSTKQPNMLTLRIYEIRIFELRNRTVGSQVSFKPALLSGIVRYNCRICRQRLGLPHKKSKTDFPCLLRKPFPSLGCLINYFIVAANMLF